MLARNNLTYLKVQCHSDFYLGCYLSLAMECITGILIAWCSHHMKALLCSITTVKKTISVDRSSI